MANTLKFGNGNWATKEGSTLAYNDENGNFKPLPFDFSRASKATVINKDGLIKEVGSGIPRIDFQGNTKGDLLLEPSRTNLITNSSNLSTWNGAAMTRTFVDDLINPSSVLGGSKLTQTSSGGYAWLSRTFTGDETFSAFVKKDSSNFVRLFAANNTVYFDIVNGTIETEVGSDITDKSIIDYGNGWFRISISVNSTISSYVRIYPAQSGSSSSGTNSLFVYGAQLEQGNYATSYIPTSGSAVTRLADICNNDFSVISTVANTNTVVLKFIPMGFDVDFAELLRFSDGTDEIALEGFSTNNYDMYGSGLTSSGMVDGALSLDASSINTISFSYSGTSLRFSHNGSTINTTTPTGNLPTITEVSHSVGVLSPIKILDLRVYNDFKTQEELNTLTI